MPYGLLDDDLAGNPKLDDFSDAAFTVWILSISFANKGLTDGYLTREQALRLLRGRGHGPKVLAELTTAHPPYGPLWETDGDRFRIHHFFENKNRSRAAVEQLKADRALAGQIGGLTANQARAGPPREALAKANAQASAIASAQAKPLPNAQANAVAKRKQNRTPDPVPGTPVPGERKEGVSVSGAGSSMKNTAMKSVPESPENGAASIEPYLGDPNWTPAQEAERVEKLKQKAHDLRAKKQRESDARFGVVRASDVGPVKQ